MTALTSPTLMRITAGPSNWPNTSRLRCADGTMLSIVVGEYLYCTPRNNEGPYIAVEVGTWVPTPDTWAEYSDYDRDDPDPYGTGDGLRVHGYVPVNLAQEFIDAHGGEASE